MALQQNGRPLVDGQSLSQQISAGVHSPRVGHRHPQLVPQLHHRADDGPAYLTILLVGHLLAPGLHIAFVVWRPEPLTLFTIFSVGCVGLSLYLLPRLKGAMIGFQWAKRMGGFGSTS